LILRLSKQTEGSVRIFLGKELVLARSGALRQLSAAVLLKATVFISFKRLRYYSESGHAKPSAVRLCFRVN